MTMNVLLQRMATTLSAQEATTDFICYVLLTEIPDDAEFVAWRFDVGCVLVATPTQLIEHKQHQHVSSRPRPATLTVERLNRDVCTRRDNWRTYIVPKPVVDTTDDDWIAKKLHATPLDYDFVVCSPNDSEIRLYSLPPRGAFGYVTLYRGNPFSGAQSPRVVIGGHVAAHVDMQIANLRRNGWQLVTIATTCTYKAALAVLQRRTPQ